MSAPTFMNLVDAKPLTTVLDNLTTGSPAVQAAISATLNSSLRTQLSPTLANTAVLNCLLARTGWRERCLEVGWTLAPD